MKLSLPVMQCEHGCGECCGPVICSADEAQAVVKYANTHNITPVRQGTTCPFFQNGKCAVYPVRPYVCQLYGHVSDMNCPRGHNVNISKPQQRSLAAKYQKNLTGHTFLHSAVYTESEILALLEITSPHPFHSADELNPFD